MATTNQPNGMLPQFPRDIKTFAAQYADAMGMLGATSFREENRQSAIKLLQAALKTSDNDFWTARIQRAIDENSTSLA